MFTNIVNVASHTGAVVSVSGSVTGGNVLTGGVVSATGNVSGNYILGNGALLTGVITSVANINSGTSNVTVVSSGGNVAVGIGGTSNVAVFTTTGEYVTGVVSANGNITGGNLLTAGQIISTKTGNSANGAAQIYLNGTGNNRIEFNTSGLAVPNGTTRSAGTKILLYPGIDGTGVDYAIGLDSGVLWQSIHDSAGSFKWYANTTAVASLTGTGNFSASGNITGGNVLTSGLISATGNIQVGNVQTAGSISATGNVLGNVFTVNTGNTTTAIINGGGNAVGNIGSSSNYFNQVFAQATTALYADLAEIYSADAEYAPGTVVSFGGDQEVTRSVVDGDNRVAGVISENPSYLMNSGLQAEHRAAVALTGRVPTLVIGPVAKGDMMISAGNGWARASATPAMGTVIGKALKNFDGDSGIIEIVVGRL
jgi:filamentous hemagglutinin